MSQFRKQQKNSVLQQTLQLGLIILGMTVAWYLFSWVREYRATYVPIDTTTVSLMTDSKLRLIQKINSLQQEIVSKDANLQNTLALEVENKELKAYLGRIPPQDTGVLGRVVVPLNRSLYNTLTLDIGSREGIRLGQKVYALGNVALGTISDVTTNASTVLLYSAPGIETVGTTSSNGIAVNLIGRGSGEYEVRMPRDILFSEGGVITEQSIEVAVIATIQKILTDPRDPFQRLLAKAPINLQALQWVVVK